MKKECQLKLSVWDTFKKYEKFFGSLFHITKGEPPDFNENCIKTSELMLENGIMNCWLLGTTVLNTKIKLQEYCYFNVCDSNNCTFPEKYNTTNSILLNFILQIIKKSIYTEKHVWEVGCVNLLQTKYFGELIRKV